MSLGLIYCLIKVRSLLTDCVPLLYRYQACLYFAAVFQAISCGIHYLASVFLVETPKFLCNGPDNITEVLFGNHTAGSLRDILNTVYSPGGGPVVVRTSAGQQWELGQCQQALRLNAGDELQYVFSGNKTVQTCATGFMYDFSEIQQNIVTDWDLVCERGWLAKAVQPTFMVGVLIGALVFGDVADRYCRALVFITHVIIKHFKGCLTN